MAVVWLPAWHTHYGSASLFNAGHAALHRKSSFFAYFSSLDSFAIRTCTVHPTQRRRVKTHIWDINTVLLKHIHLFEFIYCCFYCCTPNGRKPFGRCSSISSDIEPEPESQFRVRASRKKDYLRDFCLGCYVLCCVPEQHKIMTENCVMERLFVYRCFLFLFEFQYLKYDVR